MTRSWWQGALRHSMMSLLGCARARERYTDLDFEDPDAEALVDRVGLRRELYRDDELKPLVLVAMTLDVVIEQRLWRDPGLTVAHLGGGLSTRYQRLRHLRPRWIEVDEPAICEMKRELFDTRGYTLLPGDLGDTRWVDALADLGGPLLLVSEAGLLEASLGDFHAVLDAASHRLAGGTELLFAHDLRHPIRCRAEDRSLLVERPSEHGGRVEIRYPGLRFVPRAAHDEDVWTALEGIGQLHDLHGGRLPRITHVALT